VRNAVKFVPVPLPALSRQVNFDVPLRKWGPPLLILVSRGKGFVGAHELSYVFVRAREWD